MMARVFERLSDWVNADAALVRRGRYLSTTFLIEVGQVFKGDLFFYRADGDFRDRVSQIDTSKCPLYLLTGEYDFSCTPEDTERTAAKIKGARVTVMPEISHFPMSKNPAQFRRYNQPVLEEIR